MKEINELASCCYNFRLKVAGRKNNLFSAILGIKRVNVLVPSGERLKDGKILRR